MASYKYGNKYNHCTISQAAKEKDCIRDTIYRAIEKDLLNTSEVAGRRLVRMDDKYDAFQPQLTGIRRKKKLMVD
jgi:hypothetical protein